MERDFSYLKDKYNSAGAREEFQLICEKLLKIHYGTAAVGTRDDSGDGGIDILVEVEGGFDIYQCKYFINGIGKSQQAQIRESFKAAQKSVRNIKNWILCIPIKPSISELKWWDSWKKKQNTEIKLYDATYLLQKLKDVGLYNDVFDITQVSIDNGRVNYRINDYKKYYLDKWNSPLFLHENVCLSKLYVENNFVSANNNEKTVRESVEHFIEDPLNLMFILGNPGLGKTTIMSYLAYCYRDKKDYIFVKMQDTERSIVRKSLLDGIVDLLGCKTRDLKGKILFLDGYDEIRIDGLHYSLCRSFLSDISSYGIKVVLSSRANYVDLDKKAFDRDFGKKSKVLELRAFAKKEILSYIKNYEVVTGEDVSKVYTSIDKTQTNLEVYGLPFVLYLICSLKIDIYNISNIVELFNRIFNENEGIYEKIYDQDAKHYLTQDVQNKTALYSISEKLAWMMYRDDTLYVVETEAMEMIKSEFSGKEEYFAIGNYYEITGGKIFFVHKTFQEYFVIRYLIHSIMHICQAVIDGIITEEVAASQFFDLIFCDSYIYKRLVGYLSNMIDMNAFEKDYIEVIYRLLPKIYDKYLEKICSELSPSHSYLKSQNFLTSMNRILKELDIIPFEGVEEYKLKRILLYKGYCILDIRKIHLNNTDISGSFLRGTLDESSFRNVNFSRTDIMGIRMYDNVIEKCAFNMVYGDMLDSVSVFYKGVRFNNVQLEAALFDSCRFESCRFRGSNLTGVLFRKCTFGITNIFDTCNLSKVRFEDCYLKSKSYVRINKCVTNNLQVIMTDEGTKTEMNSGSGLAPFINQNFDENDIVFRNGC